MQRLLAHGGLTYVCAHHPGFVFSVKHNNYICQCGTAHSRFHCTADTGLESHYSIALHTWVCKKKRDEHNSYVNNIDEFLLTVKAVSNAGIMNVTLVVGTLHTQLSTA